MHPKKVLILITKGNWGGAQRYVYDVATSLPKDKYEVEVMAGSGGFSGTTVEAGEGPLVTKLKEAGINASSSLPVGRDVNILGDIAAFFKLWSMIRHRRPDILHVNSSKIGGLGSLAGRLAGVKNIIFTAHGWAFNEDRSFASKLLIRLSYWVIFMLCHRIMAISDAMVKQVRDWPFVGDKFTIVHNGVDKVTQFSQSNARHALCSLFPVLKNTLNGVAEKNIFWIGTVAELHHIKGHIYGIRAIREFVTWASSAYPERKIIYTIFGEGEERPHLEALIREYGLGNNVFLLGHTPDVAQYLQAFDVFMLASLSEGLGYVILEAGLAHCPVVATCVGGIPEVVEDMHSGVLVQPRKSQELAHALAFMLEHPEERKEYGNALKDRVTTKFSLAKMMEGVVGMYEGPTVAR